MTHPVGVILAAGLATRMGRPKQLLPYGDSTVLGSVIAAAAASRLERVIVVLGAYGEEVAATFAGEAIEVAYNPEPERGNLSSLLVAVAETGDAPVLLLMGDMPGLQAHTIDSHLDAWEHSPTRLRITEYTDGWGHPMLLSPEVVAELPNLEEPKALWRLVESEGAETLAIPTPMPIDIDTPADYDDAMDRREELSSSPLEVRRFNGEYELIAPLFEVSPTELRARDERGPEEPHRWIATYEGEARGVATARLRPDDRMFVSYAGTDPSVFRPLTAAASDSLGRPLFTIADEDDVTRLAALRTAGFEVELTGERFRISFDAALGSLRRAWLPASFRVVSAAEADEERLFALDNTLRQDVPGTDGWLGNRDWFHAELNDDPAFDPAAYLVAIHEPTGEYAGLVRIWRNESGPRLGLIAVTRKHRGSTVAAALLKQALTAASGWGHETFTTETALTNRVIYPRMVRLGAQPCGRFQQLVRR